MNARYAIVEGNLALSTDAVFTAPAPQRYETQIYELRPRAAAMGSAAPARPARSAALSMTAVVLLIVAFIGSAWFVLSNGERAFNVGLTSTERQVVIVTPGESLWTIAEDHGIDGLTTQQTSDIIRAWNDLDSSTIQPGDALAVPAR